MDSNIERWYSMKEICEYLGVSRDTVLAWIEKRNMPAAKIGRLWKFKVSEVDAWMKSGVAADADMSTMCEALKTAITEITLDGLTGTGITWDAGGAPTKSPLVYVIKDGAYEAA